MVTDIMVNKQYGFEVTFDGDFPLEVREKIIDALKATDLERPVLHIATIGHTEKLILSSREAI